jgi:hypothetical protein
VAEHTPTPWHWFTGKDVDITEPHMKFLVGANGQGMAHTVGLQEPTDTANAAFIVKAVNCHDQLVAAIVDMIRLIDNFDEPIRFHEQERLEKARSVAYLAARSNPHEEAS